LKVRQYLTLEQIRWVPGVLNPADAATRGMTVKLMRLQTTWLERPEFLRLDKNGWPDQPEPATDIYADILPETLQGVKIDKKQVKVRQAVCNLVLQPSIDQYYDPVMPSLMKFSR
jgi:hypothetical protein